MFVVQPLGLDGGDEELGPIGVGTRVGHGQKAGRAVLYQEVLVVEGSTIDTFSTSSIKIFKVSSL